MQFDYAHYSKANRRMNELGAGNWKGASGFILKLPAVLGISVDRVEAAIAQSKKECEVIRIARERDAFRPHAIILTVPNHPRPNTARGFALLHGRSRYLTVKLNDVAIDQYVQYVTAQLGNVEGIDILMRFFDGIVGVRIRYTYYMAVSFDVLGVRMAHGTGIWKLSRPGIWNSNLHRPMGQK